MYCSGAATPDCAAYLGALHCSRLIVASMPPRNGCDPSVPSLSPLAVADAVNIFDFVRMKGPEFYSGRVPK